MVLNKLSQHVMPSQHMKVYEVLLQLFLAEVFMCKLLPLWLQKSGQQQKVRKYVMSFFLFFLIT